MTDLRHALRRLARTPVFALGRIVDAVAGHRGQRHRLCAPPRRGAEPAALSRLGPPDRARPRQHRAAPAVRHRHDVRPLLPVLPGQHAAGARDPSLHRRHPRARRPPRADCDRAHDIGPGARAPGLATPRALVQRGRIGARGARGCGALPRTLGPALRSRRRSRGPERHARWRADPDRRRHAAPRLRFPIRAPRRGCQHACPARWALRCRSATAASHG